MPVNLLAFIQDMKNDWLAKLAVGQNIQNKEVKILKKLTTPYSTTFPGPATSPPQALTAMNFASLPRAAHGGNLYPTTTQSSA